MADQCHGCSTPLTGPHGIHAAYLDGPHSYCCADCSNGKACVCQLLTDPDRQPTRRPLEAVR